MKPPFQFSIFILALLLIQAISCQNAAEKPVQPTAANQENKPLSKNETAKAVSPPVPEGWRDLQALIPDAIFDIRYATENNFVGEQLYDCPACWLRPDAAAALVPIADVLREQGYRIMLFDCYRPQPIQERLWAIKPDATYVTPPSRGSMHNRGLAVDIGLANSEGQELDMGTPFDFFGRPAHHDYTGHSTEIQARRDLLKNTMIEGGFGPIRTEWWHYSYRIAKAELSRDQWPCPNGVN